MASWNPMQKLASLDPATRRAVSQGLLSFGISVLENNRKGVNPMTALAKGGLLGFNAFSQTKDATAEEERQKKLDARAEEQAKWEEERRAKQRDKERLYAQYGSDPERLRAEMSKVDPEAALALATNYANLSALTERQRREQEIRGIYAQYGSNPSELIPRLMAIDPVKGASYATSMASLAKAGQPSYGRNAAQGVNPQTGQLENFVVDQYGNQRWLGAATVPQGEIDPNAPWNSVSDPKQREMLKAKVAMDAQKSLDGMRAARVKDRSRMAKVSEFGSLMEKQDTGGWRKFLPEYLASVDPEMGRMQSITAEIVPSQREPGSGATTDADARMFERATVGYDKRPEVNKAIIEAIKVQNALGADELAFREQYAAQYGHLNGADAAWQQYLNSNPIFDPNSPDVPMLNKNRLTYGDWAALISGKVQIK